MQTVYWNLIPLLSPFCPFAGFCVLVRCTFHSCSSSQSVLSVSSLSMFTAILMPLLSAPRSPDLIYSKIRLDGLFILSSLKICRNILVPPSFCLFGQFLCFVSNPDLFFSHLLNSCTTYVFFSLHFSFYHKICFILPNIPGLTVIPLHWNY